jgi:hypothetical protein
MRKTVARFVGLNKTVAPIRPSHFDDGWQGEGSETHCKSHKHLGERRRDGGDCFLGVCAELR